MTKTNNIPTKGTPEHTAYLLNQRAIGKVTVLEQVLTEEAKAGIAKFHKKSKDQELMSEVIAESKERRKDIWHDQEAIDYAKRKAFLGEQPPAPTLTPPTPANTASSAPSLFD